MAMEMIENAEAEMAQTAIRSTTRTCVVARSEYRPCFTAGLEAAIGDGPKHALLPCRA
jgi:hypothetical protein